MKKKQDLNKKLSVIYFIDSKKTRSFSLSMRSVRLLSTLIVSLLIWSGLSVYLVDDYSKHKIMLKERLQASLDTIFEYQSRYDGVYELAYPRILNNSMMSEVQLEEDNEIVGANLTDSVAKDDTGVKKSKNKKIVVEKDISVKKENNKLSNLEASHSVVLSIDKIEKHADKNWPIVVEDISYQKEQRDFELNFSIRNSKSPERAEGYIWSVITLVNKEGEKTYISSPSGVKVDGNGNVLNPPKGANWYSIRYYKAKSFYFHIPEDIDGNLREVNISMMDLDGQRSVYTLPMSSKLIKKAEMNINYRNIIKIKR